MQDIWTAVDAYVESVLLPGEEVLAGVVAASATAGLPAIQVSPVQGKFLMLLARGCGARRILELGTLGGYSTIWLARGLAPGGQLITLELEEKHAAVARANLARAGVGDKVEIRVGQAVDSLAALVTEGAGPFDLVFIDADKPSYAEYFAWSLKLARPGTVIVADNVVRDGQVADAESTDPMVLGIRRFNELVGATPGVSATAIQTVGAKGYDGFAMIVVGQ
ncbi:MAG: O-methyltransferase [Candidatus Hydrogenedentes bacterium]|nr:O-methyltransferase [Candidatus Hydrogenedentota bacterium]MBI3117768.1 O-methyltransferase [Candidatus Hydrogenedentota bacterium]